MRPLKDSQQLCATVALQARRAETNQQDCR